MATAVNSPRSGRGNHTSGNPQEERPPQDQGPHLQALQGHHGGAAAAQEERARREAPAAVNVSMLHTSLGPILQIGEGFTVQVNN